MRANSALKRGYLVLQAYIDDSDREGEHSVLAGFIASAESWARFTRDWEELLPSHGTLARNGVYHFKMNEMVANAERSERISAFENVIYEHAQAEFSWSLNISDCEAVVSRILVNGQVPSLRPKLTSFHFLFFAMMEQFSTYLTQSGQTAIQGEVDLFFDEQSEKRSIIQNWYDYTDAHSYIRNAFVSLPRFEDDQEFLPLQAADYLAWSVRNSLHNGLDPSDRSARHQPDDFPGLYAHLNQEHIINVYWRILRQAFPEALIVDTQSDLHPVLQEERYRTGWSITVSYRDRMA